VDDDGYDDAGVGDAGRHLGNYAPSTTTGEASMADLNSYNDPYAVPPLPHLDPNQSYHDDPSNYGGHYDPYHGPVPQSFHDPASADRISTFLYYLNSGLAHQRQVPARQLQSITGDRAQVHH
jgi:hypothetical protein